MKKMLFVINPKAGRTTIKSSLFEMLNMFSNGGYMIEVYTTKGPGDAAKYINRFGKRYDLVVCAGGDGTLDNTVTGVMKLARRTKKMLPIGYIPCGSTNDFARSLRISREPVEAARDVLEGDAVPIDIGRIANHYFAYIAAFGAFTDISYSTPQKLKNMLGHSAYILEVFKKLTSLKTYKIRADFDGRVATGEYIYGQITNSLSVGGFRTIGTKHMSFCDGKFECLLIRKPDNVAEFQKIINSILTNDLSQELIVYEKASHILIEGQEEIPWTVDGEFGGNLRKADIFNLKKAVSLVLYDKSNYVDLPDYE